MKVTSNSRNLIITMILIMVGLIVAFSVWIGRAGGHFRLTGEGTKEKPYLIGNTEELQYFADQIASGNTYAGLYFQLTDDISMKDVSFSTIGGTDNCIPFSGTLDGAGYCISDVTIKSDQIAALFGVLDGVVCNLIIDGGTIEGTISGAIAGTLTEHAMILNCQSTAYVTGETTGGIAASSSGIIINCTNLVKDDEKATQRIVSKDAEGTVWNCYTNKGDFYELLNNTSQEADLKNRQDAMQNLNTMIAELSIKYPQVPTFCTWILSDTQVPVLSKTLANTIQSATLVTSQGEEIAAQYNENDHAWIFKYANENKDTEYAMTFTLFNGDERNVQLSSQYEIAHYQLEEINYTLRIENDDASQEVNLIPGVMDQEQEILIGDEDGNRDDGKVKKQQVAYLDENGKLIEDETLITIYQPGIYTIEGQMQGQIVIDMGNAAFTDGNAQATLKLNQIDITNHRGPAILIKNALETGTLEQPGVKIELTDGTSNVVNGSNSIFIYSSDEKSEGAISTNVTMGIYGNDGRLEIQGDLEGIETNYGLVFQGGVYKIKSNDDAINASDTIAIVNGSFSIDAGDDVIDSNGSIVVYNGVLQGFTGTESVFNAKDGTLIDGGMIAGSSAYENHVSESSAQGLLELGVQESFKKNQLVLMTDEQNQPLLAMELQKDGSYLAFSIPGLRDQTYHFYICDDIQGNWNEGICNEIESYRISRQLTHDGDTEFIQDNSTTSFRIDS